MPAGRPETSSAVFALHGPRDDMVLLLPGRLRQPDRLHAVIAVPESQVEVKLFASRERLHAASDWVLGVADRDVRIPGADRRKPLVRGGSLLIVEIAADPFGDLVVNSAGIKRRPVKLNEPAPPLHLPFERLKSLADIQRMIGHVSVAAVRDHHDRRGIVERFLVGWPAFEVCLNDDSALCARRRVEQMLQQDHALFVFVRVLSVSGDRASDEHDLLRSGRFGGI